RIDVGIARRGILREESGGRHELPRLAVAALRYFFGDPRGLEPLPDIALEPLDGSDALPRGGRDRRAARADRGAIELDRARAAERHAAAELGAGEIEIVPEHPEERGVGRRVHRVAAAVDGESDCAHQRAPDWGDGVRWRLVPV